jgi:hypothetical protein
VAAPNVVWRAAGSRPLVHWKRREISAERNGQPGPEPYAANVRTLRGAVRQPKRSMLMRRTWRPGRSADDADRRATEVQSGPPHASTGR